MYKHREKFWLILGGGFLSKNLVDYAVNEKIPHRLVTRKEVDFLNADQVRRLIDSIEVSTAVLVPAAVTRLRGNDLQAFNENMRIISNIVHALGENISNFVFFSTIDVYGVQPSVPVREVDPLWPDDYYALYKLASEFILQRECASRNIDLTVFRLAGLYGPEDRGKSTISHMASSAIISKNVTVTGDPSVERDFVWAPDIALLVAYTLISSIQGVFNVATGKSYTIRDIADMVANEEREAIVLEKELSRSARARLLRFDVKRLNKYFPDVILTPLHEGIHYYFNYHSKEHR